DGAQGQLSLETLGLDLAVRLLVRLTLRRELIDRQVGWPAALHVESTQGDEASRQRLRSPVSPPGSELKDEPGDREALGQRDLGIAPGRLRDARVGQVEQQGVEGIATLDIVDRGPGPQPLLALREAPFRVG